MNCMNAIDTNIFVYSIDQAEPIKRPLALALIGQLDSSQTIIPWQVVCEFGAAVAKVQRRGGTALDPGQAISIVRGRFATSFPDETLLDTAMTILRDGQVSYWDALLLAACARVGVDTLYSEDMSNIVALGVRVISPFTTLGES